MDYAVSFRDFPLCLDSRLIKYREDLENMYILDLCDIDGHLSSEKAPAVVKKNVGNVCCLINVQNIWQQIIKRLAYD